MMVRCPRPVQMPMRHGQPTAPTVRVSPLVCACLHLLTVDASLVCALAASATGGGAQYPTWTSAMRWACSTSAPGGGRDPPPSSAPPASPATSTSTTAARAWTKALPLASQQCWLAAAFRRVGEGSGHGVGYLDSVGPDAARTAVPTRVQRSRRLEVSSLHAHGVAYRFTYGWTIWVGYAVPGRSPSVRYGSDEYSSSLYTLDAPLPSLGSLVLARRASAIALRKPRVIYLLGLT